MDQGRLTVAGVFRQYGDAYRVEVGGTVPIAQSRVMTAIARCRTAALGGHVEQCDHCGHQRVWYNSCANRHCPSCQSLARAQWIEARHAELLDCEYFHVVFTIPAAMAALALQNKTVVYGILFRAAAKTLRLIAADPRHLGAEIGFFAVLHTWGSTLVHHPHVHCVVPGGGLTRDGTRWIACRPGFFLPVRVLSRVFGRLFLTYLQDAFDAGHLHFDASLTTLADRRAFTSHLAAARQIEWVVYAKRPFAGPQQVLDYVGRYTHRVAISNDRLLAMDDGHVRFRCKDYRRPTSERVTTITLTAIEFIRRFLMHVLPTGFHRIRYYGLLGNRLRRDTLAQCRHLLHMPVAAPAEHCHIDYRDRCEALMRRSLRTCPVCGMQSMREIEHTARRCAAGADTS